MSWKCNSKIIEQTDVDYQCQNEICAKSKLCGLFILLLDTNFKSHNSKLEYAVLLYIKNVQQCQVSKLNFCSARYRII